MIVYPHSLTDIPPSGPNKPALGDILHTIAAEDHASTVTDDEPVHVGVFEPTEPLGMGVDMIGIKEEPNLYDEGKEQNVFRGRSGGHGGVASDSEPLSSDKYPMVLLDRGLSVLPVSDAKVGPETGGSDR